MPPPPQKACSRPPPTAMPCSARPRYPIRSLLRESPSDEALAALPVAVAGAVRRLAAVEPVAGCGHAAAGGDPRAGGAGADPVAAPRQGPDAPPRRGAA